MISESISEFYAHKLQTSYEELFSKDYYRAASDKSSSDTSSDSSSNFGKFKRPTMVSESHTEGAFDGLMSVFDRPEMEKKK